MGVITSPVQFGFKFQSRVVVVMGGYSRLLVGSGVLSVGVISSPVQFDFKFQSRGTGKCGRGSSINFNWDSRVGRWCNMVSS